MDYKICSCVDDMYIYSCQNKCDECIHYETKRFEKNLKKGIDKQKKMCYNKIKDKERR